MQSKSDCMRFFVIYAFMSSFAVCFIVSMTLSASSRVLPTAER